MVPASAERVVLVVNQDVTALKEAEALKDQFISLATHELRTPLTSIKGAATALLSTEHLTPENRRELLTIVDEEADRLNRMVAWYET